MRKLFEFLKTDPSMFDFTPTKGELLLACGMVALIFAFFIALELLTH